MNGVGAGADGRVEDGLDPQVALGGRGWAHADGFVGEGHVGRRDVGLAEHGDARQPE